MEQHARRSFVVVNADGLHARPAAMLVDAIASLHAVVSVTKADGTLAAVTGPLAILLLGARFGQTIEFSAEGEDASAAIDVIGRLMASGFGERVSVGAAAGGALGRAFGGESGRASGPLGVSPGRAVGPIVHMPEPLTEPPTGDFALSDRAAEAQRITQAAVTVAATLHERAALLSGDARAVLEATAAMAEDPSLIADSLALVAASGDSAAHAVWAAATAYADGLLAQGGLMAERAADVHDLCNRLVSVILDRPAPGIPVRTEPFILVARDLAPADTALLDPATALAIITEQGGPTSHTSIIARALGIPTLVAAHGALGIPEGTVVFVDGATGELEIDPSAERVAAQVAYVPFEGTGATKDGHAVQLLANVGSAENAAAEGVGLFRTEFCFLGRQTAPSIAEQVAAYRPVFAAFPGRRVVVRTLDAGADKPLPFVTATREANPALGIRGLRTSWRQPHLLDDQLAAIAQAAAAEEAIVWVMAPMVATVDEAVSFAAKCGEHGLPMSGVMVETPAAALMAAEILGAVDFVSIGTNDLTQYTMAADRQLGQLAALSDPWQPAVLRLVELTAAAGAAAGKPVGVCGEAAADALLAAVLVGFGVTSLSMASRAIPAVAGMLAGVTHAQCVAAASAARGAATAADARTAAAGILAVTQSTSSTLP